MPMTYEEVRAFAFSLALVADGTSYGYACLKANGKFLTRLKEDGDSLVLTGVPFDEREMLIEAAPEVFYFTDHYRNYPMVLARLSAVEPGTVKRILERQWRASVPKKVSKAHDQQG
ncbi:MmcQ/YjbR family DNA-binding protein [Caulobacter hibisci]|nr:MmcQ/YjbR family DNA-binding protein [Caulobacter hibisci]